MANENLVEEIVEAPVSDQEAPAEVQEKPARTRRRRSAKPAAEELATAVPQEASEPQEAQEAEAKPKRTRRSVLAEKGTQSRAREASVVETQKKLSTESSLESVRRSGRILTGKVVGVENVVIGDTSHVAIAVFAKNETFQMKASIPFSEVYTSQVIDMSTVDLETVAGQKQYYNRQRQILSKMLGLDINFIVIDVLNDTDGYTDSVIIGSRRQASAKIIERAFAENGVKVGDTYEATIISVSPHSLAATFCGVDFVKQQNDLTERYLIDLQRHYKAGDKLPFVLDDISRSGDSISISANTRKAEFAVFMERQRLINIDTIARGIITRIYKVGDKINIYAWLPDYELPAKISYINANDFGRELKSGDEVQLLISGFTPRGYLDAKCRSLQGNTGLFTNF